MKQVNLHVVHNDDFYQRLRRGIRQRAGKAGSYTDLALFLPDLIHLFVRLLADGRVPLKTKAKIGLAIGYFVSPLDLIPEVLLGPVGYLDDLAIAAWVLDDLFRAAGPDIALQHWAGGVSLLDLFARLSATANEVLGSGLVKKLKLAFDRQGFGDRLREIKKIQE